MNTQLRKWLVKVTALISLLFFVAGATAKDVAGSNQFYAPLERVTVKLDFNDQNWKLGHRVFKLSYNLIEWVPEGESVDEWSKYFMVVRSQRAALRFKKLKDFTKAFEHQITHVCQNREAITFKTLESSENSALMVWEMTGCVSGQPMTYDQRNIVRFVQNDEFMFELTYAIRPNAEDVDFDKWLAALKATEIHTFSFSSQEEDISALLASIPLEQVYRTFSGTFRDPGKASLITTNHEGSGMNAVTEFDLVTSGLPADHWYAVWFIKAPEGILMPLTSGLRVSDTGDLVCPDPPAEPPEVQSVTGMEFAKEPGKAKDRLSCKTSPGKAFKDFFGFNAYQFQKGLAIAAGIQSHDGEHVALAKGFSRPISASSHGCRIELELASTDGRTYILRGSGFTPEEPVSIDWIYSKYKSLFKVPVQSDGVFTVPLFHTKKALGSRKWKASVTAKATSCQPKLSYEWGKKGMRN